MAIKDQVIANSELFSPEALPMLIEPNDWDPEREGGYLLNEVMAGHDLVRRGDLDYYTGTTLFRLLKQDTEGSFKDQPLYCRGG